MKALVWILIGLLIAVMLLPIIFRIIFTIGSFVLIVGLCAAIIGIIFVLTKIIKV